MDEKESKGTLLNRVLGRIMNKEHSPKAWKRLAGLVLAGVIGVTVTACDSSTAVDDPAKNSSSKYEDSSNLDSSYDDSSSVDEPPIIDVDYSKFSPIIQAMFNNDYYVNLTQKIQENVAKQDYTDYYSHPTKFWDSVGIDVNKIRSGEIECQTNAYVLDEEPNNLYIATYITDPTNAYYDQYIIRYTLTDQEMAEYHILYNSKVWQNFYMNDILSIYKNPEIVRHGKIAIETYKLLQNSFIKNLISNSYMDNVFTIAGSEQGKPVISMISYVDTPVANGRFEELCGQSRKQDRYEIRHLTFNDEVECSTENGIIYINTDTVEDPNSEFYTYSQEDANAKYFKMATFYYRQDLCTKLFPNMYTELKEEHLAEFLEKVNEKSENK